MIGEDLIFIGHVDLAGQFRGKSVPATEWPTRVRDGVGWPPANAYLTAFGEIARCPEGSRGDVLVVPDSGRVVRIDYEDGSAPEHFALGGLQKLDGTPWIGCARAFALAMLARLERDHGLHVAGAFEHEFVLTTHTPAANGSFNLQTQRREAGFARALVRALRIAGVEPDTFIPEYAPAQFEITNGVATGIAIADDAAILREVTRATATRCGHRATFTPVMRPGGIGNGVHLHLSLRTLDGAPATHDPVRPAGLSVTAERFFEGVRRALPALVALTAGSAISYERLQPGRWSAAFNNLATQDREAGLRVCPVRTRPDSVPARAFNVELRAADATASPHLVLGAIVAAGLDGLDRQLASPGLVEGDCAAMDAATLARAGIERFPVDLPSALDRLAADPVLTAALPPYLLANYLAVKRHEWAGACALEPDARFARYALAY
jgi:glutamine synthetase